MSINIINNNQLKNIAGIDESNLSAVAFSGNYSDLTDAPDSLPANGGNAATVDGKTAAELQNYNNLSNRPDIPSTFTDVGAAKGNADGVAINGATKLTSADGKNITAGSQYAPVWIYEGSPMQVPVAMDIGNNSNYYSLAQCGGIKTYINNNAAAVETGTWTPTLLQGSNEISGYSRGYCFYCKIGKLVFISFAMYVNGSLSTPLYFTKIDGLPFLPKSGYGGGPPISSNTGIIMLHLSNNNYATNPYIGKTFSGTSYINYNSTIQIPTGVNYIGVSGSGIYYCD